MSAIIFQQKNLILLFEQLQKKKKNLFKMAEMDDTFENKHSSFHTGRLSLKV